MKMVKKWTLCGVLLSSLVLAVSANEPVLTDDFTSLDASIWHTVGRGVVALRNGAVSVEDCFITAGDCTWKDYELSFRARAPKDAEQVQIWAGFRAKDRDHRYAIGLRGGNHDDFYLARYAPDANDQFLAIQELGFHPEPGEWFDVRVVVQGDRFRAYLNGEDEPRIDVTDEGAPFTAGGCVLGGGWVDTEFDSVSVRPAAPERYVWDEISSDAVKINFQPAGADAPEGWLTNCGERYAPATGFGWDIELGTRERNKSKDKLYDTLTFIAGKQQSATFTMSQPDGEYVLSVQVGDPGYANDFSLYVQDGTDPVESRSIGMGDSMVIRKAVAIKDGILKLRFIRNSKAGVSMNWLALEKKENVPPEIWEIATRVIDEQCEEKELQRSSERAMYTPVVIDSFDGVRSEFSLNGNWLFLPNYEWISENAAADPDLQDETWHVMNVPDFWNPIRNWLHGETGGMRQGDKGVSDNYYQLQNARVANYTFDWEKTDAAWYRQHLVLPNDLEGRHVEICFDAIAKISELWVNGTFIEKQIGMFKEFKVDITDVLKPGDNLIAVKVIDNLNTRVDEEDVQDIAVTVEVTSEMLRNLPHAIYTGKKIAGIWQPVKLVVSRPVRVTDVFAKTQIDSADVDITISNDGAKEQRFALSMAISPTGGGTSIYRSLKQQTVVLNAGEHKTIPFKTGVIQPETWSPSTPNLYDLQINLSQNDVVLDEHHTRIGFRTFEVRGNKLYLNGNPYWLRGGNHFPMAICPNDEELAQTFLEKAREGNMCITRTVCAPFNEMWLDKCDEIGMAVSYEGTWPWLMLRGEIPSEDLLDVWRAGFESLIKKYRNHPSIFMWTINNEMKFYIWDEGKLLDQKWKVLSSEIKKVRELDPTRPIVPDSGYHRQHGKRPDWADDGDIDDLHAYYGWYHPTFFHSADLSWVATPDRPLISQEMVGGGYSNNDSGHPTRYYLFSHNTPQALIGRYAYEDQNPAHFLKRSRFMYKELAEALRRSNRDVSAGIIHFAAICWFKNVYDAERIEPYPSYYGMKIAQQPVLVSAELFGRHAYAGSSMTRRVCVMNDSEEAEALPSTTLRWQVCAGKQVLSEGSKSVASIPYYENRWMDVAFRMPKNLPVPRIEVQLKLTLSMGDKIYSENVYDLTLATPAWTTGSVKPSTQLIGVYDPENKWVPLLKKSGYQTLSVRQLKGLNPDDFSTLLVTGLGETAPKNYQDLKTFAENGGRVLLQENGDLVKNLFPDVITKFMRVEREITTMCIPESPVFDGIEPGDMSWFEVPRPELPYSSTGYFQLNRNASNLDILAQTVRMHGYVKDKNDLFNFGGIPLFEVTQGKGKIIVSEMLLEAGELDPIAQRLMNNLLSEK